MSTNRENHRKSFLRRRSVLVIDPNNTSHFSSIPEISTAFLGVSVQDDSHLPSPRSKHPSEVKSPPRSRISPRFDLLSPLGSSPEITEVTRRDDRRFSSPPSSRTRTPEIRAISPLSTHQLHSQSHRVSTVFPSPKLDTSPFEVMPRPHTKIFFYHKHNSHYGFTNFSNHPVVYKGKKYSTSEHLFQSFKFHGYRPGLAEHIRTCSERPSVAFSEARRFQPEVRPDWKDVNIEMMDAALEIKFTQHPDLRDELLATGDAELVEDSDKDAFWGIGADRQGRNELGKALERLRTKLRMGQSRMCSTL